MWKDASRDGISYRRETEPTRSLQQSTQTFKHHLANFEKTKVLQSCNETDSAVLMP